MSQITHNPQKSLDRHTITVSLSVHILYPKPQTYREITLVNWTEKETHDWLFWFGNIINLCLQLVCHSSSSKNVTNFLLFHLLFENYRAANELFLLFVCLMVLCFSPFEPFDFFTIPRFCYVDIIWHHHHGYWEADLLFENPPCHSVAGIFELCRFSPPSSATAFFFFLNKYLQPCNPLSYSTMDALALNSAAPRTSETVSKAASDLW